MRGNSKLIAVLVLCSACAGCAPPGSPFTDATAEAGLLDHPAEPSAAPVSAILLFDANGDGHPDLYLVRGSTSGAAGTNAFFVNDGSGTFTDATKESGLGHAGAGLAAAAGDLDNDGDPDVIVAGPDGNVLFRNDGNGVFSDATEAAGIGGPGGAARVLLVDYHHDGFLDVLVSRSKGRRALYRNNGNGTFTDVAAGAGVAGAGLGAAASDADHDRDIDLLLVEDGRLRFYSNNRDETFTDLSKLAGLDEARGASGVVVADFNGDRRRDILALSADCSPNRLYLRQGYGPYAAAAATAAALGDGGSAAAAVDFDNDGDLDLLLSGGCPEPGSGVRLLENTGGGTFLDRSHRLPAPEAPSGAFAFGDYDSDGREDLFVADGSGVRVLRNEAGRGNFWIDVKLTGAQASNLDGLGAKVEVKAGDLWVERETLGLQGSSSQGNVSAHIGLGLRGKVELVRVTWPTGIRQTFTDAAANSTLRVVEKGQKSSCPFLFVWDGRRYRFVTDFLGAGFIGILVGPDTYYQPDPDEYLRVPPGLMKERDGKLRISVTEQLEEVDYFDQMRLLAVDHEADVEVYPNERLPMTSAFPKPGIAAVRGARSPAKAFDGKGNDVLPAVSKLDRTYPDDFQLLPYEGYTEPHTLTLELGKSPGRPEILLLDGWLRYWTSNSAHLASQSGIRLEPPALEARAPGGAWITLLPDMGIPAGLPKTVVADLSGLPKGGRTVRFRTNMEAYWDRIRVGVRAEPSSYRVTELTPASAELGWLGYPKSGSPDGKAPLTYDYHDVDETAAWRTPAGEYTRYGDVRELLLAVDDRFVVMTHGERIELSFDGAALPELAPGWERDYFVYVNGFVKEMNPHTKHLATVRPLPFHGMSNYPYGEDEAYPSDEVHRKYLREYNTRRKPG